MAACCDLWWIHGPVVVVAILTGPTLGTPRRALFPGRWRDAVFEGPCNIPSKLARLLLGMRLISLSVLASSVCFLLSGQG